jgi:hypothetical protein
MDEQVFLSSFPELFVDRRVLLFFGVFAPTLAARGARAHHLRPCSWPVPVEDTRTSPSAVSVAKDNDSNASARYCGICAFICAQNDTGVELGSLHLLSRMSRMSHLLSRMSRMSHLLSRMSRMSHLLSRMSRMSHLLSRMSQMSHLLSRMSYVSYVASLATSLRGTVECVRLCVAKSASFEWVSAVRGCNSVSARYVNRYRKSLTLIPKCGLWTKT